MNTFLLRARTTRGCLLSPLLFSAALAVPANTIRQKEKKKKKGIQTRKEVKLSLFTTKIIIYVKNPKETTKKLLELISEFNKVADTTGSLYEIWLYFYILAINN